MTEGAVSSNIEILRSGATPATQTEAYLEKLCRKSFLSLWCYPRVFNDKKDNPKAKQGKEIVDLLVIFDKHVILFSDKRCEFPDSGNLAIDWGRWKRRAIDKSIDQLYGAERWIRKFPNRIFIDPEFTKPLPIPLPDPSVMRVHRIVVANGANDRCIKELSGSGSLMICSDSKMRLPFMVGQLQENQGFVHILNETSLDVVMHELDTISDFVRYLDKKEQMFKRLPYVFTTGEEELLGFYLKDINENGEHDFKIPAKANAIAIDIGYWDGFLKSNARASRIEADRYSYAWDAIIEKFNFHALTRTLHSQSHPSLENHEKVVRYLAAESRTRRRILIQNLYDLLEKTPKDQRAARLFRDKEGKDPTYVFLLLPRMPEIERDEYRRMRQDLLSAYCTVAPLIDPQITDVVGFATETNNGEEERSEDLVYCDCRHLTAEEIENAKKLRSDFNLFENIRIFEAFTSEYPNSEGRALSEVDVARKERNRQKRLRKKMKNM